MGITYTSTGTDGPSAGAVMTVGFVAPLKGERIRRGIAVTGTINPDGTIGSVGSIPDKIRAAVREGYRTILIPEGFSVTILDGVLIDLCGISTSRLKKWAGSRRPTIS
jgi:predicted S18 family serine protease